MGLWDYDPEDNLENEDYEEKNPYLTDADKGMKLIASLLPHKQTIGTTDKQVRRLDYLIDHRLLSTLEILNLPNILEISQQLQKISDQVAEYQKIRLLTNKTIIGIGGQFSAGKSCFINSLLNEDESLLPENQTTTTSIPTYIIHGDSQLFQAYTVNGATVNLDFDAVTAMTHEFDEVYHIGFAQFVKNLVIYSTKFSYNQIAILDTPGYSKFDEDNRQSISDEKLAYEQLKAADFLIWLVDIDNGIIREQDIKFITSLEVNKNILIVFNKADKKTESDCRQIITESKKILAERGIEVFGVAAYSSRDAEEYLNENFIQKFLQTADQYSYHKQDVSRALNTLTKKINDKFTQSINKTKEDLYLLGDAIFKAEDILSIQSLVIIRSETIKHLYTLYSEMKSFQKMTRNIQQNIVDLTK